MNSLSARDVFGYHSCAQITEKSVNFAQKTVNEKFNSPETNFVYRVEKEDLEEVLESYNLNLKKITVLSNVAKVLCYIPIIGTIIGIAGLILLGKYEETILDYFERSSNAEKDIKSLLTSLRIRLGIATTSLGIVLAAPDLFYSLKK